MANLDAPNGFVPVRHLKGGLVRYTGGYTIASGEASNMFAGDAVIIDATAGGNLIELAIGAQGTASSPILGIFAGCQYTAANGDVVWSNQWVGGTATKGAAPAEAFVYADPGIVFSVQALTAAAGDINAAADLDEAVAGNAATGISGQKLDSTFGATGQFLVLGLAAAPNGINPSEFGAHARLEVVMNEALHEAAKPTV